MDEMGERQFGPYRLVQQIAVGGMAEIHLAKTHGIAGFEKYVALKMIHPNFSQDHQFIQMLIDEAKITVQLQHVNIAQTFDLGRVGDTFYITMEYVDGADLYKLLRKSSELGRVFPIPLSAFIGKEVASGLDYAHRKRDHNGTSLGIVHRDVSPQNVLLSYAGEVKLVDFGIAKATMRARQTAAGVIKGKYYYMSPEQAWGERLDHRTDIFSAGILLYETLTGQMLYLEDDLHKLLDMVRRADIPPPSSVRREVPPQLDAILMRALAKRPEDRYQSAADLAHDLERFLHAYAPVFTANKVAGWMYDVLGPIGAPTLLELDRKELERKEEPERDRGETRRLTRDQLVLARSEFTDENSIIFPEPGSGGGDSRGGMEDTSTYDAMVPAGPEPDVDSLPVPPRDQVPAGRPASRLPGVTPGPALAGKKPDRQVGPPAAPAAPRARDQETRLLKEAPSPPGGADSSSRMPVVPDTASAGPDEATVISDAPSWWSGPGDHTEVAEPPFGDQSFVPPPADVDHEAPTLLKIPPVKVPPPPGSAAWEPAPALAARVPQPAVSQLRPPRGSRRTPPGGVSLSASAGLAAQEAKHPSRGSSSVLASLLAPGEARAVPEVALSASTPTPLTGVAPPPTAARGAGPSEPGPLSAGRLNAKGLGSDRYDPDRIGSSPHGSNSPAARREPGPHAPGPGRHDPGRPAHARHEPLPPGRREPSPPPSRREPSPLPPGRRDPAAHDSGQHASRDSGLDQAPLQPARFPLPSGAVFPGPGMPSSPEAFSTRAMVAALDRDEIPEQYKIRRRSKHMPWLIGLFAFVISASVAAMLLAIYGTGENGASDGGDSTLQLISIPAGATVTMDGQPLPGRTPLSVHAAPGQRLVFGFELRQYQREEQEFVVPELGGEHQVVARLDPMGVKLLVESVPSGAEVFIGGNSVGRTPLELPGLDPQSTTSIELRLKGYRPARQDLDWSDKLEQHLVVPLTQ
jgi:eukaryotic-like serine/threonine-protein kinase